MKTQETLEIEKKLYVNTVQRGVYGAFEVTFGRERVDYITVDRKGIWRAYEVKVTKADFHSKATKSFVGHFNYYCMPEWLYEEVKDEIPAHIGVTTGEWCIKKPKKVPLSLPEETLFINLVCALNREADKYYINQDEDKLSLYRRDIERYKRLYEKENKYAAEWQLKYFKLKGGLEDFG